MLNKSVARRYAEAFFSIAQDDKKIDDYQKELEIVVQALVEVENLKQYFSHLLIPAADKKELTAKIFAGKLSPVTLNFVQMIIDKRRETYLELITEEFREMADESRNIAKAELISAQEVSEEEIKLLEQKLSVSTGKIVQLKQRVDSSLIGGVKIRIGDRIIDGSVAKRLEILKQQLMQVKIS